MTYGFHFPLQIYWYYAEVVWCNPCLFALLGTSQTDYLWCQYKQGFVTERIIYLFIYLFSDATHSRHTKMLSTVPFWIPDLHIQPPSPRSAAKRMYPNVAVGPQPCRGDHGVGRTPTYPDNRRRRSRVRPLIVIVSYSWDLFFLHNILGITPPEHLYTYFLPCRQSANE